MDYEALGVLAIAAAYVGKEILSTISLKQVEAKLENYALSLEFENIYGYPPHEYMSKNDIKKHIIANNPSYNF